MNDLDTNLPLIRVSFQGTQGQIYPTSTFKLADLDVPYAYTDLKAS
jgi:hypothetical protein